MSSQGDLFRHQRKPFTVYSGTTVPSRQASKDAGDEAQERGITARHRQALYLEYQRSGDTGLTDAELVGRIPGLLRHCVPARRLELAQQLKDSGRGRLVVTGERRQKCAAWKMVR